MPISTVSRAAARPTVSVTLAAIDKTGQQVTAEIVGAKQVFGFAGRGQRHPDHLARGDDIDIWAEHRDEDDHGDDRRPKSAEWFCRNMRQGLRPGETASGAAGGLVGGGHRAFDPWVDAAIDKIGDEVHHHHHQRGKEQDAEQGRRVAAQDRSRRPVPRPGQAKTVSTSTPEITCPNCSPAKVTTGMIALRRACL